MPSMSPDIRSRATTTKSDSGSPLPVVAPEQRAGGFMGIESRHFLKRAPESGINHQGSSSASNDGADHRKHNSKCNRTQCGSQAPQQMKKPRLGENRGLGGHFAKLDRRWGWGAFNACRQINWPGTPLFQDTCPVRRLLSRGTV